MAVLLLRWGVLQENLVLSTGLIINNHPPRKYLRNTHVTFSAGKLGSSCKNYLSWLIYTPWYGSSDCSTSTSVKSLFHLGSRCDLTLVCLPAFRPSFSVSLFRSFGQLAYLDNKAYMGDYLPNPSFPRASGGTKF